MIRRITSALLLLAASTASAFGAERSIIVLDGSGSMWGQIGGKTKIEIARETLVDVLGAVPPGNELGLMVYGHREKGSCTDIELAVAPAAGTAQAIADFAKAINPKGKTPLSAAVKKAAEALRYTEDKSTVILVTDGLETCEADPCALARELEQSGVDFTAHVVGFGLSDEEGKQVACLAETTGGKYLKAEDAGSLGDALRTTVAEATPKPKPEPEPAALDHNVTTTVSLSETGADIADNNSIRWDFYPIGDDGTPSKKTAFGAYTSTVKTSLPAGRYLMRTRYGKVSHDREIEVADTEVSAERVVLDAGIVTIIPKRTPEDGEPDKNARVDVFFGNVQDGAYGKASFVAAAGPITIRGKIGSAIVEEKLTLAAGDMIDRELVIASGLVAPSAVYAEGGPAVEGGSIRFTVVEAKADLAGKRKQITGQYGSDRAMDVPAGEVILQARLGKATANSQPFMVSGGERTDVLVNINAGVLAISAPGARRIDIIEGKADIQGNRKKLGGVYGETMQETLHPGDYIVMVKYEGDRAPQESKVTVTAGERTEANVE